MNDQHANSSSLQSVMGHIKLLPNSIQIHVHSVASTFATTNTLFAYSHFAYLKPISSDSLTQSDVKS